MDFVSTRIDAFDSVGVVGNPIVATSAHEPSSVFVAYQVLLRTGVEDRWVVRVAKSIDRGLTFPAFVDISPASVTPDQAIRGARGARDFMRNQVFMDYFATPEGWHYVVWEDAGQVYFSRSEPSAIRRDGLSWSTPQRLSLAPAAGPHPRDFQPVVAGSGSRVAVVFYEQNRVNASTFVSAWLADGHGDQWSLGTLARDDAGASVTFEPCLLRNRSQGYFGDYIDVAPMDLPGHPDDGFYASWTDSRVPAGVSGPSCPISAFENAVHQHTYGAVFR